MGRTIARPFQLRIAGVLDSRRDRLEPDSHKSGQSIPLPPGMSMAMRSLTHLAEREQGLTGRRTIQIHRHGLDDTPLFQ